MSKKRINYGKILSGMEHCFGCWTGGERECSGCPYEEKNDQDDMYGDAPSFCMEAMQKDVKRFTEELAGFCHCEDCMCWRKNVDQDGNWDPIGLDGKEGLCTTWNTVMHADEFCARGARND